MSNIDAEKGLFLQMMADIKHKLDEKKIRWTKEVKETIRITLGIHQLYFYTYLSQILLDFGPSDDSRLNEAIKSIVNLARDEFEE